MKHLDEGKNSAGGSGGLSAGELAAKIAAAREAQRRWAALSYRERSGRLKKAGRYMACHAGELVDVIHRDTGKLRLDALAAEVLPAVMALGYYIKQGKRILAPRKIRGGNILMFNKKSRIIYKPYGVVGIISPWNYPFSIPFSEVVMALLAGNGVLLKVASDTPEVGRALAGIFSAADLPEGLFSYVEIPGKEAGPAFISGGVDKLFFTGSTAVGRELMALAAPRLLPLVLELGGADAAIVCSDADLDRAAAGLVWAGFSNAGQSCGGVQRILVHQDVYDAFLKKFCALVEGLRPGDGPAADLGPMISLRQKRAVQKQVEACIAAGAVVAARSLPEEAAPGDSEGDDPAGLYAGDSLFAPALALTQVTEDMPVMTGEIFGPVAALIPVADDQEALRIANRSSYGLTGSVWSRNSRRAKRIAREIHAGAVMINDHLMSHGLAETPWGGFGDSGIGKTHGEPGFREMCKAQVIVDDILPGVKRNLWWQPYSEQVFRGMEAILHLLAGPSLFRRIRAIPGVLQIFFRYWKK
ncbi:MAG: aldehyde dehydrogenase family protein [Spirochaetaceae bacterium]|jgi:succinate-semialdehyde dehydrogenase/glutarate-semialdehyde dehydrogenase|nr:aldehyde dehydrogenase family protein [Spirochaetaceae bacterium]